jgi:hypothetical protein
MSNRPSYREEVQAMQSEWYDNDSNHEPSAMDLVCLFAFAVRVILALAIFGVAVWLLTYAAGAAELEGIAPSTCRVSQVDNHDCNVKFIGSGVLIAKADGYGYVLTCRHVVEDGFNKGHNTGFDYLAMFPHAERFVAITHEIILPKNPKVDLALLKISPKPDVAPRAISWQPVEVGTPLYTSGFGGSQGPLERLSRSVPVVHRMSNGETRRWDYPSLLLLSKPIRGGDSGCPIIDQQHRLRGIGWGTQYGMTWGVTLHDQQWLRDALPENSIVVKR